MTKERLEKASKLKLIMTAGVGSDHIDLKTAADKGMTVVEVSGVQMKSAACSFMAACSWRECCTFTRMWHCCKCCSSSMHTLRSELIFTLLL